MEIMDARLVGDDELDLARLRRLLRHRDDEAGTDASLEYRRRRKGRQGCDKGGGNDRTGNDSRTHEAPLGRDLRLGRDLTHCPTSHAADRFNHARPSSTAARVSADWNSPSITRAC